MAYGIDIRNSNGRVLIDGQNQNYFLILRRAITVTFNRKPDNIENGWFPKTVFFPSAITTQIPPYLCLRHTGGRPIGITKLIGSPGNWRGFDACTNFTGNSDRLTSSVTSSIEYEVYINAQNAIGAAIAAGYWFDATHGIIVNDAGGGRVFDSRLINQAIISTGRVNTGISEFEARENRLDLNSYDYFAAREGAVVLSLSSSTMIDFYPLMAVYGRQHKMRPFLVGNTVQLHFVWRHRRFSEAVGFYGSHTDINPGYMLTRRQSF
ncbi:hypothetical protein [Vreelandella glaciei]|uniref:hypothetical protein n=1 Tax=Vreelandella glaciei TaxID=186761 RepID=UPI0030EBEB51|tara:strand:- start:18119 stop:18913 length:795 start_codon:yes stop_codon:yes gene_type:complete